jgi:alpha-beta hydrolase superfamily lysophospholipase
MKPTFVIVHGAWHSPSHFAHLIAQLQKLDYPAVAAKLPSVGSVSPLLQSVIQDTDSIKESFLNPLLEDGKDVILVTHSYGGVPGCAAVKGLSKAQRKNEGQRGGVIGIICISSYLVKEAPSMGGESGNWPPFCIVDVCMPNTSKKRGRGATLICCLGSYKSANS